MHLLGARRRKVARYLPSLAAGGGSQKIAGRGGAANDGSLVVGRILGLLPPASVEGGGGVTKRRAFLDDVVEVRFPSRSPFFDLRFVGVGVTSGAPFFVKRLGRMGAPRSSSVLAAPASREEISSSGLCLRPSTPGHVLRRSRCSSSARSRWNMGCRYTQNVRSLFTLRKL